MKNKTVKDVILFITGVAVGSGVLILASYLKHGSVDYVIVLASVATALVWKLISLLWEKRWGRKTKQIAENMNSKEERAKSRNYAMTHGFSKLHGKSMKDDLIYRVQKGCLLPLFTGVLLIVVGAVPSEGALSVRIVMIIIGMGALAYGIYRLTGQSVRSFLRKAEKEGKNIEEINADYMKGRLIADKRSCVSIGDKYTVCLNGASNIFAFENSQIAFAAVRVNARKVYVKGVFSGGDRLFEIYYLLKEPQTVQKGIAAQGISVGIKRYQTELAYEEYQKHGIELKLGFLKED